MHNPRDVADLWPFDARHRIEIDAQFVRMIEVGCTDRVRVQFEAREVGHPRERGGLTWNDFFGRAA